MARLRQELTGSAAVLDSARAKRAELEQQVAALTAACDAFKSQLQRAQREEAELQRALEAARTDFVAELEKQRAAGELAEERLRATETRALLDRLRRIADGVKVALRYKTTDQVERAFVEDHKFQFMYHDGEGFHFMNMESYDQVALPADIIGEQAAYLQPEMEVTISLHDGVPVAIELPPRAVLEVVETEPTVNGQTAASSYKPALLSNGVRTMVPSFVTTGTKIVVATADGTYVERSKE